MSWSPIGSDKFCYGTQRGIVSIRAGTIEKTKLETKDQAEIWSIEWLPVPESKKTQIIVFDWSPGVTIFEESGSVISPTRQIEFDPCCSASLNKMPYLAVGGAEGTLLLMSRDGVKLQKIDNMRKSAFIWSTTVRSIAGKQEVITGNNEGFITCSAINVSRVHGMFRNQYACRDNLTDMLVRQLDAPGLGTMRIKCREIISKIAVFEQYVAAQCRSRMKIFNFGGDKFENISIFEVPEDTSLIVIATMAVVICQGERLTAYDFTGQVTREWVMTSTVRYVKMFPGIPGSECMLVATADGSVSKIFLDSPFPIQIQKINNGVYLADFDQYRDKMLVLDEKSILSIFDVESGELLHQEPGCTSASFNSEHSGLLCFTTEEELLIKTENKITFRQKLKLNQRCVGFYGSWVHLMNGTNVETILVPQTGAMYHYLEVEDYEGAYDIGCIGVTSSDWNYLGNKTLKKLELKIAKKAFTKTNDYR